VKGRNNAYPLPLPDLAPNLGDAFVDIKNRVVSVASQEANDFRLYETNLVKKVGFTSLDLPLFRIPIGRRAAFQDITDKYVIPGKADMPNQSFQQSASPTHERSSLQVLFFSRSLADKDHIGRLIPFAKNDRPTSAT
jgi:hypothetical protein